MKSNKARVIAFYLPQFHPIPENDKWWGKGFTEWTNVAKAKPLFRGHYQPRIPADLGFYDLRLEEARLAQEHMAKEYGIHGFCYYHYWFNGRRVLYEPLDRKLKNSKENLPFMMCWANENWTRAWDGGIKDVLLEQNYSEDDDREHIRFLISYFKDERYIKVNGKPFFIFYKRKERTNLYALKITLKFYFLFDICSQIINFYSFLLHSITVTHGNTSVFFGIKVISNAKRGSDLILTAVSLTN